MLSTGRGNSGRAVAQPAASDLNLEGNEREIGSEHVHELGRAPALASTRYLAELFSACLRAAS